MANSVLTGINIDQASGGNAALRQLLQQLTTQAQVQATKTNTSGKNPPNQSTATVTFQNPLYIVNFTDPGGATAASLQQQAQQAAANSLGYNSTQSVIYHQVHAATSILFDSASLLETYGGDTGSLQTQFVIGDLSATKQWYFRIRTSFDGQSWNQWKILNNDKATAVNQYAATLTSVNGGQTVGITLLGQQVVTFGVGTLNSGQLVEAGQGVILQNLVGILGPNGYVDAGFEAAGTSQCEIDGNGQVICTYTDDQAGTQNHWPGAANFLTFGFVLDQAQRLSYVTLGDGGKWAVLTLPGGAQIAIGCGQNFAHGATFDVPTGFDVTASMGVAGPAVSVFSSHPAYGVSGATVVNGTVNVEWADSSGNVWPSTANWMAIAWSPQLAGNLVTVSGGQYLKVPTLAGDVMIGVGATENGGVMPLPAGYTYPKCLAFATPASFDAMLTYAMHGVQLCTVDAGLLTSIGTVYCLYGTVTGPRTGKAAWFSVAWP